MSIITFDQVSNNVQKIVDENVAKDLWTLDLTETRGKKIGKIDSKVNYHKFSLVAHSGPWRRMGL